MSFILGKHSLAMLEGVNPKLVELVKRAIQITTIDFGVSEGLRTIAKQADMVAKGLSRTTHSRHITGHAVDVLAYYQGKVSWEWEDYADIATAFRAASIELSTDIVWGGVWDETMHMYLKPDPDEEHREYTRRYMIMNPGRKPLVDGPHFELSRAKYG